MRSLLLAATLFSAVASAQPVMAESAIIVNDITRNEVWASYAVNFPPGEAERKQVLANLKAVCDSDRRADKKRCARAWGIINEEYAKLQARKASEAAQ